MAKADEDFGIMTRAQRRAVLETSPVVTQSEDSLNQLGMRLKAGAAKWTPEQRKDIEMLAGATKQVLAALRGLLDMNAR
jgi:hypothetical protein